MTEIQNNYGVWEMGNLLSSVYLFQLTSTYNYVGMYNCTCICMYSINSVLVQKMFTACIQPCCTYLTAVCCFYDVCTRVGVVKIGIIFTDGKATRSFEHHLPTLDNLGVRRFAIPINSRWNRQGLQRLASIPPGLHVLTGRGIHTIDYLVDTLLSGRFCRGMYMCVYVGTYALVVCKLPT